MQVLAGNVILLAVDAAWNAPVSCFRGCWSAWGAPQTPCMAEGYCVKCKAKKEIVDAVEEVMKNGRKAIKGRCPTCGTIMFKILGGKATVAPSDKSAPETSTTS